MQSSIVKVEVQNGTVKSIEGTNVTVLVVDYDGDTDTHNGKSCTITLMDYTTHRKDISESIINGIPDFPLQASQVQ